MEGIASIYLTFGDRQWNDLAHSGRIFCIGVHRAGKKGQDDRTVKTKRLSVAEFVRIQYSNTHEFGYGSGRML